MCTDEFYSTNVNPEEIRAAACQIIEDGLDALRYKYEISRFVSKWKYQYPVINIVHDLYITLDMAMLDYYESLRCKTLITEYAITFEDVPIKEGCNCDMDGMAFMLARLSKETDEKAAYETIKEYFEYEKGRKSIVKGVLEIQKNTEEEQTLYPMLYEKAISFLLSKDIKFEEEKHTCIFYLESFYHVWNVKDYQKFFYNDFDKWKMENKNSNTNEDEGEYVLLLPIELNTEKAQRMFKEAINKGWINVKEGNYEWIGIDGKRSKAQLGYLCAKIYGYKYNAKIGNEGENIPYEALQRLFSVTRLDRAIQQVYEAQKTQRWRQQIDEIIK